MRVVFVCNSSYQILVAAALCRLQYPEDTTVLALDGYFYRTLVSGCNLINNSFFNDVVCLNDESIVSDVEALLSIMPDRVHLFNWGTEGSCLVNNLCCCPVDMTDEGIGSYQLQKMWENELDNLNKLSAIWLLAPELSQDYNLGIPIKQIRIIDLYKDEEKRRTFLNDINHFFNYVPETLPDIIYFDRYFVSGNMMPTSYERSFLLQMAHVLSKYHACLKPHPSESTKLAQYRYRSLNLPLFHNTRTPWEVILLNHLSEKPIVLISINSTPIVLSKILSSALGARVEAICLIDWVRDYVDPPECFIETLVDFYNSQNPTTPILRLNSAIDLSSVLESFSFLSGTSIKNIGQPESVPPFREKEWLRNEFLWYSKTFGNLIDTVRISLEDAKKHVLFSDYQFYSWRDQRICLTFQIDEDFVAKAKTIHINLSSSGIVKYTEKVQISLLNVGDTYHWYSEHRNNEEIVLSLPNHTHRVEIQFDICQPLIAFNYRDYIQ